MAEIAIDIVEQTLNKYLKESNMYFSLVSKHTKEPFVICDEETFDDMVPIYFNMEDALADKKKYDEQGDLVDVVQIDKGEDARNLLVFYTGISMNGVNALEVKSGEMRRIIQLDTFIKRTGQDDPSKNIVENRELNITALYFLQKMRNTVVKADEEEARDLQEELIAHFQTGKYLIAMSPEPPHSTPLVKAKDGEAIFQPIFTDFLQFTKFNVQSKGKFQAGVIEAANIPRGIAAEAVGVIINPMSYNFPLKINRPSAYEK